MLAKVVIFCAALAAAQGSLISAPLVSTGISAESRQQDAWGNYAYGYDIRDGATGFMNVKAESGKAVGIAAPAIAAPLAYAVPAIAAPYMAAPAIAAPAAYGAIVGRPGVLGLGHGAALGYGYGAGILGAGLGKALI
ncbi:hypothetical protein AVEN_42302-1 [Araneus ventricosus]|uniref:Uncharacterized protein n=1 Tax=Araneus ventricosus TaxID=182803 RepID=A0A4Y2MLF9_ARAVE|nr:hypothetical protein AVEN_42302-1 [Araneus ventricosus]